MKESNFNNKKFNILSVYFRVFPSTPSGKNIFFQKKNLKDLSDTPLDYSILNLNFSPILY